MNVRLSKVVRIVVVALCIALGVGCGGGPEASLLEVHRATEPSRIGFSTPSPGNTFISLQIGLSNPFDHSIRHALALFRVRTDQGLEVSASATTVMADDACPIDAFLVAGQTVTCTLIFEISIDASPNTLLYSDMTATPPLESEAQITGLSRCTRCSGKCTELATDIDNCGVCGREVPLGGECVDGNPVCGSGKLACEGECVSATEGASTCMITFGNSTRASCDALCANRSKTCQFNENWPKHQYRCGSQIRNLHGMCSNMPAAMVDQDGTTCQYDLLSHCWCD